MHIAHLVAVCCAASLAAQTFNYAPRGHANLEGGSNNTIPWWSRSATYQQIHDASDLTAVFGAPVAVINSIHFRKDADINASIAGRSLDAQITLGHTPIPASAANTTFAANLGSAPMLVLPYTTINLPQLNPGSYPEPVGWSFPFLAPFPWVSTTGNLCWEVRFRASTDVTSAALDAVSSTDSTYWPLFGGGCLATGQSQTTVIETRSVNLNNGDYRNRLVRAATSSGAVLLLGGARQQINVPGLCAPLEFLPLVDVAGGTDGSGVWDLTINFGPLAGTPSVTLIAQFAYLDAGLGLGLGLSNASQLTTPPLANRSVARIWSAPFNGGTGNELATTGIVGASYGLVTIFGT